MAVHDSSPVLKSDISAAADGASALLASTFAEHFRLEKRLRAAEGARLDAHLRARRSRSGARSIPRAPASARTAFQRETFKQAAGVRWSGLAHVNLSVACAIILLFFVAGCRSRNAAHLLDAATGETADLATADALPATLGDGGYAFGHPHLPIIPSNRGAILSPLNLVFVLASGDPRAAELAKVPQDLLHGSWWTAVTQSYGITAGDSSVLYGAELAGGTNMTLSDIKTYIGATLTTNGAPLNPGNTLYLFFFPENAHFVDASGVIHFDAAHYAHFDSADDAYGYVSFGTLANVTWLASHEILEAATDTPVGSGYAFPYEVATVPPWQQSVWAFSEGHEVGDMCERLHWTAAGTYSYARIWSNDAAAQDQDPCIPSRSAPYYNVGSWETWVPVTPGATVTVQLAGWSTDSVADWPLTPVVVGPAAPEFRATVSSSSTLTLNGQTLPAINNGGTAVLTVNVDSGVSHGDYAVVRVESDAKDPFATTSSLAWAVWPVGFYVP